MEPGLWHFPRVPPYSRKIIVMRRDETARRACRSLLRGIEATTKENCHAFDVCCGGAFGGRRDFDRYSGFG
jgi:hypothetical protein